MLSSENTLILVNLLCLKSTWSNLVLDDAVMPASLERVRSALTMVVPEKSAPVKSLPACWALSSGCVEPMIASVNTASAIMIFTEFC